VQTSLASLVKAQRCVIAMYESLTLTLISKVLGYHSSGNNPRQCLRALTVFSYTEVGCYESYTAKVRKDLLESQKKYTKNKYCKYHDVKKCSNGKRILKQGFERRYCSIPIDV